MVNCPPLSTKVILASMRGKKDPAAVSLGRKGGKASAKKLTAEQRQEKARKAALHVESPGLRFRLLRVMVYVTARHF